METQKFKFYFFQKSSKLKFDLYFEELKSP